MKRTQTFSTNLDCNVKRPRGRPRKSSNVNTESNIYGTRDGTSSAPLDITSDDSGDIHSVTQLQIDSALNDDLPQIDSALIEGQNVIQNTNVSAAHINVANLGNIEALEYEYEDESVNNGNEPSHNTSVRVSEHVQENESEHDADDGNHVANANFSDAFYNFSNESGITGANDGNDFIDALNYVMNENGIIGGIDSSAEIYDNVTATSNPINAQLQQNEHVSVAVQAAERIRYVSGTGNSLNVSERESNSDSSSDSNDTDVIVIHDEQGMPDVGGSME